MKTRIATITGVLMSIAAARSGFAAEVSHSGFKGTNANATFLQVTPITCDDQTSGTDEIALIVQASSSMSHGGGDNSKSAAAQLVVLTFNSCTGVSNFGQAFVSDPKYSQGGVAVAHLRGTVPVLDFFGQVFATVALDMTWKGMGTVDRSHTTSQEHVGPFVVNSEQTGASRLATVSGSATVNGVNVVPGLEFAALSDSQSGSVTVIKN